MVKLLTRSAPGPSATSLGITDPLAVARLEAIRRLAFTLDEAEAALIALRAADAEYFGDNANGTNRQGDMYRTLMALLPGHMYAHTPEMAKLLRILWARPQERVEDHFARAIAADCGTNWKE